MTTTLDAADLDHAWVTAAAADARAAAAEDEEDEEDEQDPDSNEYRSEARTLAGMEGGSRALAEFDGLELDRDEDDGDDRW